MARTADSPTLVPPPQDICNQRRHRQRRTAELVKLQAALRGLSAKAAFYEAQGDCYSQYLQACLGHLAPGSKWVPPPPPATSRPAGPGPPSLGGSRPLSPAMRRRPRVPPAADRTASAWWRVSSELSGAFLRSSGRGKKQPALRYTAAQLLDKGVLLGIEGLPASQYVSPCPRRAGVGGEGGMPPPLGCAGGGALGRPKGGARRGRPLAGAVGVMGPGHLRQRSRRQAWSATVLGIPRLRTLGKPPGGTADFGPRTGGVR